MNVLADFAGIVERKYKMAKEKRCNNCYTKISGDRPYCDTCSKHIDINTFGNYRIGLSDAEIKKYLSIRANTKKTLELFKRFDKAAGCNTAGVGPEGQSLMYREDVKRFADLILLGKATYFD